ncbi:molybdenum cofactor biosynthesis protein MoaE [soil metagenome]
MAKPVCEVLVSESPLVLPGVEDLVETGALVDFYGIVRLTEGESEIAGIEYEAHHAMAEHQLRSIAEEAGQKFELQQIMIQHRIGYVPVGVASLLVRVGSRHRAAAFAAGQWVVDELKRRAPIWKHPQAEVPERFSRRNDSNRLREAPVSPS